MAENGRDKRRHRRYKTSLQYGQVLNLNNRLIADCVFKDRSAGGARLRVPDKVALPQRVRLFDHTDKQIHLVDVMWHRGNEIGVRFVSEAQENAMRLIALAAREKSLSGLIAP